MDPTNKGRNTKYSMRMRKQSFNTSKMYYNATTIRPPWNMESCLGFRLQDLTSLTRFTKLMYQPKDPSSLGIVRILFGLLMVFDTLEERGLSDADLKWGDPKSCKFPLFNFFKPLPLEWMCLVYLLMLIGAVGIMLGASFRWSCFAFLVPYWYLFLLDKSSWNNHTYMYGLLSIMFFFSSANSFWSVDAMLGKVKKDAHVPLWNYAILRFQIFILYFIAGLKKLDQDWITGYSMSSLSNHWLFDPFTFVLTRQQIDFWIIHIFGFLLDLTIGFWMYFDRTRPVALIFLSSFHIMNSRIFSIGMFPYVCLATMPLFCHCDWPRKLIARLTTKEICREQPIKNDACIYPETPSKNATNKRAQKRKENTVQVTWKQCFTSILLLSHVCLQFFLPYSHFLTKGYNNWTNGLYGYSWDMMVHTWDTILVVVKVVDKNTGKEYFLDPEAWVNTDKWSKHADMIIQYTQCLRDNIQDEMPNLNNISINIDVWCSLNRRFQQRMFDPNVDLLTADWSPFKTTPWLMPLLTEFSSWRDKMSQLEQQVFAWSNYSDILFVADFPGLYLENYIHKDLSNVTLMVLEGDVIVEIQNQGNFSLPPGHTIAVPTAVFHKVHTVSKTPSCYMYTYMNQTLLESDEEKKQRKLKSPSFALAREMKIRWNNLIRGLALVSNAILKVLYSVPMVKRVRIG